MKEITKTQNILQLLGTGMEFWKPTYFEFWKVRHWTFFVDFPTLNNRKCLSFKQTLILLTNFSQYRRMWSLTKKKKFPRFARVTMYVRTMHDRMTKFACKTRTYLKSTFLFPFKLDGKCCISYYDRGSFLVRLARRKRFSHQRCKIDSCW